MGPEFSSTSFINVPSYSETTPRRATNFHMALLGALAAVGRYVRGSASLSYARQPCVVVVHASRYDMTRQEVTFRRSSDGMDRVEGVDKFLEYLEMEQILDHWDSRRLSQLGARSFWFELRKLANAVYRPSEREECFVFEMHAKHE